MKRLNKEYILDFSNDIDVRFGSVNKDDPKVIYLSGKCWVSPKFEDDYNNIFETIKRDFKHSISTFLFGNNYYSSRFILDFDINCDGLKMNHKKFLSFNIFFRQANQPPCKLTNESLSDNFSSLVNSLLRSLRENEFSVSKRK